MPDLAAIGLGLAAGVIVDLDDDVALVRQRPADALVEMAGPVAGRPAAQAAVDRLAGTAEARIARPRVGLVALAGLAGDVDVRQDVMDDAAVARPELDRRDVLVFVETGRDDEAAIDVLAAGGHVEIGPDVDNQVGRAELPVVGKLGRGRQVGRVSLGRAALGPGHERRDILVGERAGVLELGTPTCGAAFQGGITRSSTTAAMSDARFRACS